MEYIGTEIAPLNAPINAPINAPTNAPNEIGIG